METANSPRALETDSPPSRGRPPADRGDHRVGAGPHSTRCNSRGDGEGGSPPLPPPCAPERTALSDRRVCSSAGGPESRHTHCPSLGGGGASPPPSFCSRLTVSLPPAPARPPARPGLSAHLPSSSCPRAGPRTFSPAVPPTRVAGPQGPAFSKRPLLSPLFPDPQHLLPRRLPAPMRSPWGPPSRAARRCGRTLPDALL